MSIIVETPFQNFTGLDGKPLTNGKVYIGQVGTDPTVPANQIPVFWDEAMTVPASQPLRTNAGYIVRVGTPSRAYISSNYSLAVYTQSDVLVYYIPNFGVTSSLTAEQLQAILNGSGGSYEIGFIQFGVGAILRNLQGKGREIVSILDFGGDASGSINNNNVNALSSAFTAGHRRIRLPQNDAGNVYYFSGALPSSLTVGLTFDVDPGVVVSVFDIGYFDTSLKFTRDTKVFCSALQATFNVGPTLNRIPSSRAMFPGYADRDESVLSPIICNSELQFKQVTFNTDAFTAFSPSAATASSVTIDTSSTSDYLVAFKKVSPGDEIEGQFVGSVSGASPIAMIRTSTSYYGLAVGLGDTAQPSVFAKSSGSGTTSSNISYLGMGTHASYAGYRSNWSIRINSLTNFSIIYCGYEVYTATTNDEIFEAGFGTQGGAGGQLTFSDWTSRSGGQQLGKKAISIAVFGDSTSDPKIYGNWPDQLVSILDEHYGMRVLYLDNYAHSGDSSAAQLALCTPTNIARADIVLIMIGVNDIQSGVSESAYLANITSMINTCKAEGKLVVFGTPTMFYGQAQAGAGVGQAATNYEGGKGIRAKCIRACADLGVKHVDTLGMLGPILADWVNPALSSVANLGRDPVVYDNIHPTLLGRMVLARAFAASIFGMLAPVTTLKKELTPLPVANLAGGWSFTTQPGKWSRDSSGRVYLNGLIDSGASIIDGTVIYTLPENIRPLADVPDVRVLVFTADATKFCKLNINATTGQITIYSFPVGAGYVSLDSISFPTKK